MPDPQVAPYGSWRSALTVEMAVAGSVSLREIRLDGDDVYWIEGRPQQGGRQVVVRRGADGVAHDVTPADANVRTMVHEYGGGAYAVAGGVVFYSEMVSGRIHRLEPGGPAVPITPEGSFRYADLSFDATRDRLLCVREEHTGGEVRNTIVTVPLAGGDVEVLAHGADFYSHPRVSRDGARVCWLSWRHPDMPWDATELWAGTLAPNGSVASAEIVAGGSGESVAQPAWAPDGSLVCISDRSGWWNPYILEFGDRADAASTDARPEPEPLVSMEAEFADPQWVFGISSHAIDDDGTVVAVARRDGRDSLLLLRPGAAPEPVELEATELASVTVRDGRAYFIAGSPVELPAVVRLDLVSRETTVLRRSGVLPLDRAWFSVPRPITFPTSESDTAHALFYPPTNPDFRGPDDERPPLIVISHGGPTANATTSLDLEIQLFTSRGIAVVDVDYRGSSGYGRAYRRRLEGQWGIFDVADCENAARYLVASGAVDPDRLAIRGGSAGGYTTLCAVTFGDVFRAGASHYGVGDVETLARDTHKFESRYLDRLLGPYPERRDLYVERSPIHYTERIGCPLIVLQGLDDKVVPPAQAEQLVAALDAKGLRYAYLAFEGEGHGFRRGENIRRALEAELSFYAQIFGWSLADPIEAVPIAHLGNLTGACDGSATRDARANGTP